MKPLILIADPDQQTCTVLKDMLEDHGTSVLCTGSGMEALQFATDFLPSVIISEGSEHLPERDTFVNGLAADPRTAAIPIIRFGPRDQDRARKKDRHSLIVTKPIPPAVVVDMVEAILRSLARREMPSA